MLDVIINRVWFCRNSIFLYSSMQTIEV